ncbi:MAG: metallophosphoesterase family protein [Chloroflexi bacterium]|nr:metallophosphoesterase family protein [Chloroflexota bacterium]
MRKNLTSLAAGLGLGLAILASAGIMIRHQQGTQWISRAAFPSEPGQTTALTRGPYLQSVTTNSVIVVWNTNELATSHVNYGPTTTYISSVNNILPLTHHAITLTNLTPDTVYHYQIASNGQVLGGDHTFRTADLPTQSSFSFAVLGDTRTGHLAHQGVVDRIVGLEPDFVLHSGDFVNNGTKASEWDTFFDIERSLMRQAPLFGALGNHERNSQHYYDAFHLPGNEQWYSFDYGNTHFVALQLDGYANYTPGSPQYIWLENDLANTDRFWKIVFLHPPLHSSGRHGGNETVRDALGPLFADYDVDLVFSGHDHDYERSIVGDVVYVVTGGGGAPLYEQEESNPYSVYFASVNHCVSISINANTLTGVGVEPNGAQFDPFILYKPIPHWSYLPLVLHQPAKGSTLLPPVPPTDGP